jgi:DNA repair protein RadD
MLKIGEAARYLGVSAASVRLWSNRGLLPAYRTPGGQRRFDRADLDSFIHSMRDADREASEQRDAVVLRTESNSARR